jgi:hypothetical protein
VAPSSLVGLERESLIAEAAAALGRARSERAAAAADRALSRATARGEDVRDLGAILAALDEGRVGHLFVDATLGTRSAGPRPHDFSRGSAPTAMEAMSERLMREALATGARVTVVDPPPSWGAACVAGAVAVLRW